MDLTNRGPGDPGSSVSVVETHISTLFFAGDRVFKLKKAMSGAFVDFSTVEARSAACHREVELNRRLSPDVYLGVAELSLAGELLDHFVVMLRLPPERRLSARLDQPDIDEQLERIAALLARFHREADRSAHIDAACTPGALRALWSTGVDQLRSFVPDVLAADQVDRMDRLAHEFVDHRAGLVEARIAQGRACDGHGDLLAEDIFCLDDGPRVLDCLEFDDELRYGDVLADVAFLAMDLERLGRPDLATTFLAHYRRLADDAWPTCLAHFHIAYRAHIRSKVTCLRHQQGDPSAAPIARSLHELALGHLERARGLLVLVGGAPGTGKTTVARGLADRLGATRLSTDEVRDQVVPDDAGPAGELFAERYAPEHIDAVYDELLRRAAVLLAAGEPVVLDASWSGSAHRARAEDVARAAFVPLVELECRCPPPVAQSRVARRAARGADASEVTPALAATLAQQRDPWPRALHLDTVDDPATVLDAALRIVDAPPR